jgi:hypothetical protein
LIDGHLDDLLQSALDGGGVCHCHKVGLFGKIPEYIVEHGAQRLGIYVADDRDLQVAAGEIALAEGFEVGCRYRVDGLCGSGRWSAIGMARKGFLEPRLGRDLFRAARGVDEVCQKLLPDTLDGIFVKARLGQRQTQ